MEQVFDTPPPARWEWRGRGFELNLMDAACMRRCEGAFAALGKASADQPDSASAAVAACCAGLDAFFDGVFGAGTAAALFGGSEDALEREEAYASVLDFMLCQGEAISARRQARLDALRRRYIRP